MGQVLCLLRLLGELLRHLGLELPWQHHHPWEHLPHRQEMGPDGQQLFQQRQLEELCLLLQDMHPQLQQGFLQLRLFSQLLLRWLINHQRIELGDFV